MISIPKEWFDILMKWRFAGRAREVSMVASDDRGMIITARPSRLKQDRLSD